jgi:enediyne biosynthesis protein E4
MDLDILVVNHHAPPSLRRNNLTGPNPWLKVRLEGVRSNRTAIGATVTPT